MSRSGQQVAKDNIAKFQSWIAERDAACDWADYIRGGKLNRAEISAECAFARSVLQQNPAIKEGLQALEQRLVTEGILQATRIAPEASNDAAEASARATDKRIMAAKGKAEARVKDLEEQNAALRTENHELREQLRQRDVRDEHLARTGRLLPP